MISNRLNVSATNISIPFSSDGSIFFVNVPAVFVWVEGDNHAVIRNADIYTESGPYGRVYTGLNLTFDAAAVGKQVNIIVTET